MSDEMKNAFDVLDINTKRNQISVELTIINELIKKVENKYNIKSLSTVKNYDQVTNSNLDESEILTFFYEDIYNIEQELITLLSALEL